MKQKNLYTTFGFAMLLLMSMNLVLSTLHSHHHIQWNHPGDFADTGNCFTNDTTVCPICGHLFQVTITPAPDASHDLQPEFFVAESRDIIIPQNVESLFLARAPPVAV